jgi:hypothetical protein
LGDEVAASSAAHGAILEDAARKTAIAETQTADPVAKAKLQQLQAALTATGAEKKIKAQTELETANAAMIHAQAAREALGQKNSKTTGLTEGALRAVDDLERELETNPSSPRIAQLRASLALEINKLQGGRFNEEIHKMNNALTPGNEDFSVARRLKAALSPGANKKDFDILREHIRTTGSVPPNPTYEAQ